MQVKDNMAKTWKILNVMTNRSKCNKVINVIENNNVKLTSPSAIAEQFNDFFVNIGSNLARKIPTSPTKPTTFLKNDYCKSMFLAPTTSEEIADIVSNLKNSSSSGYDNIPTKLIKYCNVELAPVLAHINNESLVEGIFPPPNLKIAKIVPIFKTGNASTVSNYRPISILSVFSKVFEKIVHARLEKYLLENAILHRGRP